MKWQHLKKAYLLLVISFSLLLSNCKDNKEAAVEKAVKGFFEGMYDRDFEKARAHATEESAEVIGFLQHLATTSAPDADDKKPTITVSDINIENDSMATAMVKAEEQPNQIKMSLKKIDNEWRVAFDERSLALMLGQDPDNIDDSLLNPQQDATDLDTFDIAPIQQPSDSLL